MFLFNGISLKEIFYLPTQHNWMWLSAASLLGFVAGNYFSIMHIRTAGEKLNSLLSPAITAFTIGLSYFILHDKLAFHQWLGVLLVLFTIVYFLVKYTDIKLYKQNSKALFSGIATIVCISLTIICTMKGVGNLPFLLAIWLRLFIAFLIIIPAFLISYNPKQKIPANGLFYISICIGVLAQTIAAAYLLLYASFHVSTSIVQIIMATLPLFMYAIDVYLLKKSTPSLSFLITALVAGVGIVLAMV